MGILDGFWFWIGKALAELAVGAAAVAFIVIIYGLLIWNHERGRKKRESEGGKP